MSENQQILVVDRDEQLRDILCANFAIVGYSVVGTADAEGACAALDTRRPDAIVFDADRHNSAPAIRQLRQHPSGATVPLIVLTAGTRQRDTLAALEAGADDVVARPFAPDEILARVRSGIRRAEAGVAAQPLTGLPGNGPIETEIRTRLKARSPWSVLYLDLDGFKAFNDAFGFAAGDDVLRLLADAIREAVRRHGEAGDFIGHVGGDDFVVVTVPARADAIGNSAIEAFDRGVRKVQRDTRVPYCTVSIAHVSGSTAPTTYDAVGERAAKVKKEAKRRRGSVLVAEGDLK